MPRAPGDHGSYAHAVDYAIDVVGDSEGMVFLRAWREGALDEWPEFYAWIDRRRLVRIPPPPPDAPERRSQVSDFGSDPMHYRWPFVTIDFEASSLGPESYPIEAGICIWDGPGLSARTWSSLIRPEPCWDDWNPSSQDIHGIPRPALSAAPSAADVLGRLNELVGIGGVAMCDGGRHDRHWLLRLEQAAGRNACFLLGSWHAVIAMMPEPLRERAYSHHDDADVPHRAGPDAEQHVRVLAHALSLPAPLFWNISSPGPAS